MSIGLQSRRALLLNGPWVRNDLWRRARAVPSLDLRFADDKSLTDAVTGQSLVTFTRASSGTYVGSDGLIKTAVTNLVQQSADISNAYWTKSETTVTANAAIAPDGTTTAGKLVESTANSQHTLASAAITWAGNAQYTATFYAKAAERSIFDLLLGTAGNWVNSERVATFNASSGVITFNPNSPAIASIQSVGNGWYRCRVTATTVAAPSASSVFIRMCDAAGLSSYQGIAGYGIYIWGAQLEQSSTVGEYIPTTSTINSAPRFDHNPTTGESLGLLVEEQRSNLCLQSAAISTSPWAPNGSETCVASTLTDPAGGLNAFKINFGGSGSFERWQQAVTVVSGTTYTLSAWVRSTSGTALFRLRFVGGVQSSDLTATTTWQRFSFTLTAGTTAGFFAFNAPSTGAAAEIHVWGAQLEAGAFPTSYIPTTTAAVTRSADVASITGTAFSSWYRQDAGSVFVSSNLLANVNTYEASFTDNTGNNHHYLRYLATQHQVVSASSGVANTNIFSDGGGSILSARTAYSYGSNSYTVSTNGLLGGFSTTTGGIPSTVDRLNIGFSQVSGATGNLTLRRLAFFPQRLSNPTLQALTQ